MLELDAALDRAFTEGVPTEQQAKALRLIATGQTDPPGPPEMQEGALRELRRRSEASAAAGTTT